MDYTLVIRFNMFKISSKGQLSPYCAASVRSRLAFKTWKMSNFIVPYNYALVLILWYSKLIQQVHYMKLQIYWRIQKYCTSGTSSTFFLYNPETVFTSQCGKSLNENQETWVTFNGFSRSWMLHRILDSYGNIFPIWKLCALEVLWI